MKPKNNKDYDYVVKGVILGDNEAGLTNILLRYCDKAFSSTYSRSKGIDFKIATIQVQ